MTTTQLLDRKPPLRDHLPRMRQRGREVDPALERSTEKGTCSHFRPNASMRALWLSLDLPVAEGKDSLVPAGQLRI